MKFIEDFLFVAPTPVKLAEELASWFLAQLIEAKSHSKPFFVAISGGNTPILFFNQVAATYGKEINWRNVHFFWVDERCVSPDHHESNYFSAFTNLLMKISIPSENIHRMKGEGIPEQEAENYEREILSFVPVVNKVPRFDVVFLGMGDDGHTGSIFPNQSEILKSEKICVASVNPNSKQNRITLTPHCINHAGKIVFEITGFKKACMVNEILIQMPQSKNYPSSQIKPVSGNLYWFLDAGAAKGLFS
jgi:6-phosphogluconolactonase